ncbi:hypothetical protein ABW19_dt0206442 [Dactylella cylindrospora]|nr:hypothetical protein ABW19_dt0206442 [Dactylella cylindrospora]
MPIGCLAASNRYVVAAKKEPTPAPPTPVEKAIVDSGDSEPISESRKEPSLPPIQAEQQAPNGDTAEKDDPKSEQVDGGATTEPSKVSGTEVLPVQNGHGSEIHNQDQGGNFWNNQPVNQYPNQNGQYQSYNNMGWSGYDQSSGYGIQGGWTNGMQPMMDTTGSFNGIQSFPDGYSGGMGNMAMGFNGYGQGGYGSSGMGMQGQGNWGNGWGMQNGVDGSNFNSSGMNAGFYPGAGGYNHQSYGNQSQQNHMMPHHQFQSRGYHHNQFRNNSNQNMRGNYGQQQQFGGPRNQRGFDPQVNQGTAGNDISNFQGANGGGQDNAPAGDQATNKLNSRSRGESSEKVLVNEVSNEQSEDKDPSSSMNSETNGHF